MYLKSDLKINPVRLLDYRALTPSMIIGSTKNTGKKEWLRRNQHSDPSSALNYKISHLGKTNKTRFTLKMLLRVKVIKWLLVNYP